MRQSLIGVIVFTLAIIAWVQQGNAEPLPTKIGACSATTITDIGYRLDTPDSGSAIVYANGGGQVSYDTIPEIPQIGRQGEALPCEPARGLFAG